MKKTALILAILFLCLALYPSHLEIPKKNKIMIPTIVPDYQNANVTISAQARGNYQQSDNKWRYAVLSVGILLFSSCMVVWFYYKVRPASTVLAFSPEISFCIGGHAPPLKG